MNHKSPQPEVWELLASSVLFTYLPQLVDIWVHLDILSSPWLLPLFPLSQLDYFKKLISKFTHLTNIWVSITYQALYNARDIETNSFLLKKLLSKARIGNLQPVGQI